MDTQIRVSTIQTLMRKSLVLTFMEIMKVVVYAPIANITRKVSIVMSVYQATFVLSMLN